MKTAIILLITAGIVYKVFSVIYKEYKIVIRTAYVLF